MKSCVLSRERDWTRPDLSTPTFRLEQERRSSLVSGWRILRRFLTLAAIHDEPGLVAESKRFDGTKASVHVASHTNALPCLKGKTVMQSGRQPSPRSRLTGSKTEWTTAASNARYVMSLMAAGRGNRPALFRLDNGCRSSGRTEEPHLQRCG